MTAIDLDYDPAQPGARHFGWMLDDNRPILAMTTPRPGANASVARLLVGMHDYYTGLDLDSFTVTADFAINGIVPGANLAPHFKPLAQGVWELKLAKAITDLPRATVVVSVKNQQGNRSVIERSFTVPAEPSPGGRRAAR